METMIGGFRHEFSRYKEVGEKALKQVSDDALNRILSADGNSIAMIVRHISGNFVSRFTDLLTTDGEKPWRKRDTEFETRTYTRAEVEEHWQRGWGVVEAQLERLSDRDLQTLVQIRGLPATVFEALTRSAAHVAYHVGQIVLLARIAGEREWKWISIPKGLSEAYNRDPNRRS